MPANDCHVKDFYIVRANEFGVANLGLRSNLRTEILC